MEDSDDDTGYPPSSHIPPRPKARFRNLPPPNHFSHRYADDEEEDIDEEDEDEAQQNHTDQPLDDDEEDLRKLRRRREYSDDDDVSSSDSRGKRRRIDNLSLGFEFARREPPVAAAAPSKPPARTSPPDWSEESTFLLLDAWGDRYVQNGRKGIRSDEWTDVAKKVSLASKVNRSDAQCRNRVDTLKKKYKKEKACMAEHGNAGIKWVYFKKMDSLMSLPSRQPPAGRQQQQPLPPPPRLQCGIDAGKYVFATPIVPRNDYAGIKQMRDTPRDSGTEDESGEEDGESVGFPWKKDNASRRSGSSFKMLVESIQKFGQVYEKIESNKRQQMVQLERMRKEFQRDLEAQKRQILERVQVDIAKLREELGEEGEEAKEAGGNYGDYTGSSDNLSG